MIFGLVASLSRPGGNITGIHMVTVSLAPKRLQLLHEAVSRPGAIAMLVNATSPYLEHETKDVQAAALVLGREVRVFNARAERELDAAFAALVQQQAVAVLVSGDPILRQPARSAGRAGRALYSSRDLPVERIRYNRRPDELWQQHCRCVSPRWRLHWQNSQGRQAGRSQPTKLIWSSTSGPPRPSGSRSRRRSCSAPIR
jgi:hypothetical protein